MATETMKTATRDGVTLRYVETGAGEPTILFLHGWCCSNEHFRYQVPHFAPKHRVVALDQRGHGLSDKPDQDYTIGGFVEDAAWLIRELGLDRPVIVGHSMGGCIALNFAHKHPELTRGVVLIDSPIFPLPDALAPVAEQMFAGFQSPAYVQVAESFSRAQFFNEGSPAALVDEVCAVIGKNPQRLMSSALQSALDPANMPVGDVPVPALYIRAGTQYASEDDLRGRYPNMEVVTIPVAHFVQMERPEETNELIAKFVERVS